MHQDSVCGKAVISKQWEKINYLIGTVETAASQLNDDQAVFLS